MTLNVTRVDRFVLAPWRISAKVKLESVDDREVLDFKAFGDGPLTEKEIRSAYRMVDDVGILEEFLEVSSAGAQGALRFARRYGRLHLDARGLPTAGHIGDRADLPIAHRHETVEQYVFYSRVARAVLDAARGIQREGVIPVSAWEPILNLWDAIDEAPLQPWLVELLAPLQRWKRPSADQPHVNLPPSASQTLAVSNTVNWWIRTSWIAPRLHWVRAGSDWGITRWEKLEAKDTRGKVRISHSGVKIGRTFGTQIEGGRSEVLEFGLSAGSAWAALGVRLAEAVSGISQTREAHCSYGAPGCLEWFPVTRAPQKGRRPCCGEPGCLAAAAVSRQRARRERLRRRI